jgi:hypothetical protein
MLLAARLKPQFSRMNEITDRATVGETFAVASFSNRMPLSNEAGEHLVRKQTTPRSEAQNLARTLK